MPIRVTCTKCHTRFNVSEKFAGKEGPCPKCKTTIRVPEADNIVIAVPDDAPKDQTGRSLIKPIFRKETRLSAVQITLIVAGVVGFLLAALVIRIMNGGDISKYPWWLNYVAAFAIAPPIAYSAYSFLRDQELGMFLGPELRNRVLICSAIYAMLWFAMPVGEYVFDNYEMGAWIMAMVPMLVVGGLTAKFVFDFDFLIGAVHYGMYLGICLIGRLLAGIGLLPGMIEGPGKKPIVPPAAGLLDHFEPLFCAILGWF